MSVYLETTADNSDGDQLTGYVYDGEECSVRISNGAAENGYEQDPGPLTWLNSARITADPEEDAVHCVVSVGDPRGGFCFTVRRMSDGRLAISYPYPGEGMAHMKTEQADYPGTLFVVGDFSDPEPEWMQAVSKMDRERVVELLEGISIACYDDESTEELREALIENVKDGNLDRDDVM